MSAETIIVTWAGAEGLSYQATFHGMELSDLRFSGNGVDAWLPVQRSFSLAQTLALSESAWMERQALEENR